MITGTKIWSLDSFDRVRDRVELADMVCFDGHFYVGVHEGDIHYSSPAGVGRILRSADGQSWESVALFRWQSGDVREPKLSVTAEGQLMVNTSIYFVSNRPRGATGALEADSAPPPEARVRRRPREKDPQGQYYQLDGPGTPDTDDESRVARQSVTWLSPDGVSWSSAYACPSGINTWRWEVSWYNGMGYSVGYCGKDSAGTLYRTRDGKSWRVLKDRFLPGGLGNETSIAFDANGRAVAVVRDGYLRPPPAADAAGVAGSSVPAIGLGKAPYYTEWEWQPLRIDWEGNGDARPAHEVLRAPLGGPKVICLTDGRFLVAGRVLGPGQPDGCISLFLLDPDRAVMTFIDCCDGTTYGGIAERDGKVYVVYCSSDVSEVRFGQIDITAI